MHGRSRPVLVGPGRSHVTWADAPYAFNCLQCCFGWWPVFKTRDKPRANDPRFTLTEHDASGFPRFSWAAGIGLKRRTSGKIMLHGMQKVRGSNLLSSTAFFRYSFELIVTIANSPG